MAPRSHEGPGRSLQSIRPSVAWARRPGLFGARLNRLHGIVGKRLAELGHLTERLVTEHVSGVPVDRAVAVKNDIIVRSTVQGIVTSGGSTSDSTVLKTTGGTGRQRVATTSSDVETLSLCSLHFRQRGSLFPIKINLMVFLTCQSRERRVSEDNLLSQVEYQYRIHCSRDHLCQEVVEYHRKQRQG